MHYLRGNRSESIPSIHLFVDTESTRIKNPSNPGQWLHRLRLWRSSKWTFNKSIPIHRFYACGKSEHSFWEWVYANTSKHHSTYLWAHNAAWDFTQLQGWREIEEQRLNIEEHPDDYQMRRMINPKAKQWRGMLCLDRDCFAIGTKTRDGHSLTVISSTNFFRSSLDKVGELYGMEKTEVDFDACSEEELMEHCLKDVEILEKAIISLISWVKECDLGKFRITVGGQAMAAYRHRFLEKAILIHNNPAARAFEREAHFGGECIAYKLGQVGMIRPIDAADVEELVEQTWSIPAGPVYELDANSLFPSVMAANLYPCKLLSVVDYGGRYQWPSGVNPRQCIAAVKLSCTDRTFPVRYQNRTTFANGVFSTILCGPELADAVCRGAVRSVGTVYVYEMEVLFNEYVRWFHERRLRYEGSKNKPYAALCKSFLNSLYGKWAQRSPEWVDCPELDGWVQWGPFIDDGEGRKDARQCRAIAGRAQVRGEGKEPGMAFPAISAFVTSYARERMRHFRQIAGERNVYYQGVDSLHTNACGYALLQDAGLIHDSDLGKLRLEGTHQGCIYWGPMDYQLGTKLVRAGWKERGRPIGDTKWSQDEFETVDGIITRQPDGSIRQWQRILKHEKPWIHGRVDVDGRLIPLRLPEREDAELEREFTSK